VGAHAPFDRGQLVAAEALSKGAKELSHGSWLRLIGFEGSTPSPEGIPLSTSPLASNTSKGISRKWLEPWPYMGPLLDIPYFVYSREAVEPRSRASFRSLVVYSGLKARSSIAWKCSSVGLPFGLLGHIFLGGERERRDSG
jgi:hypothetical protein